MLVGSGSNIQAVSHALRDSREIEPYGFVARTPVALLDGLRDFRSLEQLERHFDSIDEVLIADADFPEEEAVELVDRCHQQGVRVRVAPSTMEILMDRVEYVPGQALPLFELKPPVFEGVDFALKRTFDLVGAHAAPGRALAGDDRSPRWRSSSARAAPSSTARSGQESAGSASPASSSGRWSPAPSSFRTGSRTTTRWAARCSRCATTRA